MAEAKDPDRNDAVKEDQLWKVMVWKEKKAAQEWEKNWSCLLEGDAKGVKEPLPDSVSVFSDRFPSTSSRAVGGRLATPLGRELVRLDRLLWAPPFSLGARKTRTSARKNTRESDPGPGELEDPAQT